MHLHGLLLTDLFVHPDDDPHHQQHACPAGLSCSAYHVCEGGQGAVYQARQDYTHNEVALKVLRDGVYASERDRKRFQREIEIIAQLKHPNIVRIFHSSVTGESLQFFVMEYLPGQPLHQYVQYYPGKYA